MMEEDRRPQGGTDEDNEESRQGEETLQARGAGEERRGEEEKAEEREKFSLSFSFFPI